MFKTTMTPDCVFVAALLKFEFKPKTEFYSAEFPDFSGPEVKKPKVVGSLPSFDCGQLIDFKASLLWREFSAESRSWHVPVIVATEQSHTLKYTEAVYKSLEKGPAHQTASSKTMMTIQRTPWGAIEVCFLENGGARHSVPFDYNGHLPEGSWVSAFALACLEEIALVGVVEYERPKEKPLCPVVDAERCLTNPIPEWRQ